MSAAPDASVVILPLAAGDAAVGRATDLLDALFFHEPGARVLVIDDDPADRHLADRFGRGVAAIANPRLGRGDGWRGGNCAGLLTALRWVRRNMDVRFALKIDDDALVIAPFARAIAAAADESGIGLLGAHECSRSWAWHVRKLGHPVAVWGLRRGRPRVTQALWGWRARVRSTVRRARTRGYRPGEHCQGGAYAISRALIDALETGGWLDDPMIWLDSGLTEDLLLGVLCRAAGFGIRNMKEDGQPFAIRNEDLLDTPQRLLDRGFSLIHSLKRDRRMSETEIRAFFRAHRVNHTAAGKRR